MGNDKALDFLVSTAKMDGTEQFMDCNLTWDSMASIMDEYESETLAKYEETLEKLQQAEKDLIELANKTRIAEQKTREAEKEIEELREFKRIAIETGAASEGFKRVQQ